MQDLRTDLFCFPIPSATTAARETGEKSMATQPQEQHQRLTPTASGKLSSPTRSAEVFDSVSPAVDL